PNSAGCTSLSEPPYLPIGVRAAPTMTTFSSAINNQLYADGGSDGNSRRGRCESGRYENDAARSARRTYSSAVSIWARCSFPLKSTYTDFHSENTSSAADPASRWPFPVALVPPNGRCTP